ncbi:MAG: purine nucleoside permease [Gammaproteobacteria bacterium]|nr:purine nucleoside permease [Gammaproteobacteria bacterium]|tara:strand:+ start:127 stop:1263 length:1137 start_codon:yes stop_codon:yes gene_type:complete
MTNRHALALPLLLTIALAGCARAPEAADASGTGATSWQDCRPGHACAAPFKVRFVVVTMFEIGDDSGDAPGEFQFWKTRRGLDTRVPFPQGHHDLYLNEETGVLGMVTGIGTLHSTGAAMALALDQRFDLTEAYWLVAGIAGIDPEDASIGSAVWSAYLVDGDLGHEIDAREIPEGWDTGYFARHTEFPYDPDRPAPKGEVFRINESLRDWAFELTRDLELPDLPGLAATRAAYTEHPNARRPPFVLTGGHIAAMTFWHGEYLNDWANDWVSYWTDGATDFVTSAMEDTGTYQSLSYAHETGRVDKHRFMVLRAGSNYTMPPPGVGAVDNLLRENDGYAGMEASLESLYLVGSAVMDEILDNWDVYADTIPGGAPAGG